MTHYTITWKISSNWLTWLIASIGNTPDNPKQFKISYHMDPKRRHIKNKWQIISILPQPATHYWSSKEMIHRRTKLFFVDNLFWYNLNANNDTFEWAKECHIRSWNGGVVTLTSNSSHNTKYVSFAEYNPPYVLFNNHLFATLICKWTLAYKIIYCSTNSSFLTNNCLHYLHPWTPSSATTLTWSLKFLLVAMTNETTY